MSPRSDAETPARMARPEGELDETHVEETHVDITMPPTIPELQAFETTLHTQPDLSKKSPEQAAIDHVGRAIFHAMASLGVTGMLVAWWVGRGQVPALDAQLGAAFLVMHMGAWLTAWLAIEAAVDSYRINIHCPTPPVATRKIVAIVFASSLSLMVNTAMVMTAVLP